MADPSADIIFRLTAENDQLKAKLAESEVAVEKVTASTDQLGDTGEATGRQLEESFERAKEKLDEFGAGINHTNDPLRGYAVAADDAGVKTDTLVRGLGRMPGPAGQAARQLGGLRVAASALPAPLVATAGAAIGVVAQFEALYRVVPLLEKAMEGYHRTIEVQNAILPELQKRVAFLRGLGPHWAEAAEKFGAYIAKHQSGNAAIQKNADEHALLTERVNELKIALAGNEEELQRETAALFLARNELERTGEMSAAVKKRWEEQAGAHAELLDSLGKLPPELAKYRKATEETQAADTSLDDAHKELLDGLGEGTEKAAERGEAALTELSERARTTAADVARDAQSIADALRLDEGGILQQEGPRDTAAEDAHAAAAAKREEVAALEEQNNQLVVTEGQVQALAAARDELFELEREATRHGTVAAEEQHEQAERQQFDMGRVADLTDDAIDRVLDFRQRYGEAGAAATGELDALLGGWIAQRDSIGVTSETVQQFGADFEAAFARAEQQAERHGAQIEQSFQRQQEEAQATADDLADLNLQHDELAAGAGRAGEGLDEESEALKGVADDAGKAKKGLGELGETDLAPMLTQSKSIREEWVGINVELQKAKTCIAEIAGEVPA